MLSSLVTRRTIQFGVDGYGMCTIVRFKNAHQSVSQFKHIGAKRDYYKLGILRSFLKRKLTMQWNWTILSNFSGPLTLCMQSFSWSAKFTTGQVHSIYTHTVVPTHDDTKPLDCRFIHHIAFNTNTELAVVYGQWILRRIAPSGMLCRAALVRTDVSEALSSSETSVLTRAARRNSPEDAILHSHHHENLKSYTVNSKFKINWKAN
jgi:hypothetical protein